MFTIKITGYRIYGSLGESKEQLRSTAKSAYLSFVGQGRKVTICRPGIAAGASFSTNKHPRNGIVGAVSPLTV